MLTQGNGKFRAALCGCEKDQTAVMITRVLLSEMCRVEAKTLSLFCCMTSLSTSELHVISSYCAAGMDVCDVL
jgi:hypothetical protein